MRQYLILLIALAGCAAPAPGPCAASSCEAQAPLPADAPLAQIVFEECRGIQAFWDLPKGRVHVPEAFRVNTIGLNEQGAHLLLEPMHCGRVVAPGSVDTDVGILWVSVAVQPVNESWDESGFRSYYALGAFATHENVSKALRGLGATPGDTALEIAPTEVAGQRLETWTFRGDSTHRLSWTPASGDALEKSADRHFWFGSGPFHRMDFRSTATFLAPLSEVGGLIEIEGSSPVREALVADRLPFLAETISDGRWTVGATPNAFEVQP